MKLNTDDKEERRLVVEALQNHASLMRSEVPAIQELHVRLQVYAAAQRCIQLAQEIEREAT
ncbi:MAG: hypothetical protein AB7I59_27190 [Geminicoccaceae bacterium]|uniref:hypothetical protein n=1 Tax=Reyranella sp. TaxID=1929291 RepID=UPI003D104427